MKIHGMQRRISQLLLLAVFACNLANSSTLTANAEPTKVTKPASVNPNRFIRDIKMFEENDERNPPSAEGTEFVGSSSIALWKSIPEDFKEWNAFGRGFGGSTIPEVTHYADRIITNYKPARIVFYAGTNDIAELGHSGKQVFESFMTFVRFIKSKLPDAHIYFVSMSMAPSRVQWKKQYEEGNSLVRAYCKTDPKVHYINVVPFMQDRAGKPIGAYFGLDQLHMNRSGYLIWIREIKKALGESSTKPPTKDPNKKA